MIPLSSMLNSKSSNPLSTFERRVVKQVIWHADLRIAQHTVDLIKTKETKEMCVLTRQDSIDAYALSLYGRRHCACRLLRVLIDLVFVH